MDKTYGLMTHNEWVEMNAKLRGHGMKTGAPKMVYFVDATAYVEGHGYRVSIVVEGENGHRPTGDDDWQTNPRARMPYFWGPSLADAERAAEEQNERMGISKREAFEIVSASMFPKGKIARKRRSDAGKKRAK